jgi:serine/threonine protein kinase
MFNGMVKGMLRRVRSQGLRPTAWTFRKACHDNLVSLLDFYTESNSIFLAYEYIHLAISLDCLAGIVDMSEADIATVCREILNGLVYIHSELRISHGSIDCSNILLNEKGEVKLGKDSFLLEIRQLINH